MHSSALPDGFKADVTFIAKSNHAKYAQLQCHQLEKFKTSITSQHLTPLPNRGDMIGVNLFGSTVELTGRYVFAIVGFQRGEIDAGAFDHIKAHSIVAYGAASFIDRIAEASQDILSGQSTALRPRLQSYLHEVYDESGNLRTILDPDEIHLDSHAVQLLVGATEIDNPAAKYILLFIAFENRVGKERQRKRYFDQIGSEILSRRVKQLVDIRNEIMHGPGTNISPEDIEDLFFAIRICHCKSEAGRQRLTRIFETFPRRNKV